MESILGRLGSPLTSGAGQGQLLAAQSQALSQASRPGPTQAFKQELASALDAQPPRPLSDAELARMRKTAQEFEGQIIGMVFKQLWATVKEDSIFGDKLSSEFYREMWIDEVSDSIASGAGGLGIAQMVEREMLRHPGKARKVLPGTSALQ